jgi:myo-inositol-1(or 4)-monophosphatase
MFPGDGIFGEEGSSIAGNADRIWVIDPINGTFNLVRGGDQWASAIWLYERQRPEFGVIYAPVRQQMLKGGRAVQPTLNGRSLAGVGQVGRTRAAVSIEVHPNTPVEDRLEPLRFIISDARMSFRCCGSATISLLEMAVGQVDGHIGIGESTWDVMAALAILEPLGVTSTINWSTTDLSSKLKYACGSPSFLDTVAPVIPRRPLSPL